MAWDDSGTTTALTAAHNNQIVNGGGGRGIGNGAQQSQNSEWERRGKRWRRIKQSWSMVIPWQIISILSQRFGADSRERMEIFVRVICTHLPTWALYVSTIVVLVLVPTYVHANMLATHENDTTLTGPKMEQNGSCRRMTGGHFPTCCRHVVRHVNVASKLVMPTSDKPN